MQRIPSESKTESKAVIQNYPRFNKQLWKLLLGYLHPGQLDQVKNIDDAEMAAAANDLFAEFSKPPTISDIINIFSVQEVLNVLPPLVVKLPKTERYTKTLDVSKLAAEQKKEISDRVTDTSGKQLCISNLTAFFQDIGLIYIEKIVLEELFKHKQKAFEAQIKDALEKCKKGEKLVSPQPIIPYLAKILKAFCLIDNEKANDLLKDALTLLDTLNHTPEDEFYSMECNLPGYVVTFLIKNLKAILYDLDMNKFACLITMIYNKKLKLLFQLLLDREDSCSKINTVKSSDRYALLIDIIFSDPNAIDFHQILVNNRACLEPIADSLNYLFWCCKNDTFLPIIKLFLARHPHLLNQRNKEGDTPLFFAAVNFNKETVSFLLEQKGVELTAKTNKNETLLHTLIRKVSKMDQYDYDRESAAQIIKSIMQHPSDISSLLICTDDPNCYEQRPIEFACELGEVEIARQLQVKAQSIPDEKLALAASIDAPVYKHKDRQVSALEYEIKRGGSLNSFKVLNLIIAGAKYTFSDDEEWLLKYIIREMISEKRFDAIEPLCNLCKQSRKENIIKETMEFALQGEMHSRIGFVAQFISTFNSFTTEELDKYQKICTNLGTCRDVKVSEFLALREAINKQRELLIKPTFRA